MTDLGPSVARRFCVGITSVLRRCVAGGRVGVCLVSQLQRPPLNSHLVRRLGVKFFHIVSIVVASCTLVVASPLRADIWTEFYSRCLEPMEKFDQPFWQNLIFLSEHDSWTVFESPDGAFAMNIVLRTDNTVESCSIYWRQKTVPDKDYAGSKQVDELVGSGRYTEMEPDRPNSRKIRSHGWRNPHLIIHLSYELPKQATAQLYTVWQAKRDGTS